MERKFCSSCQSMRLMEGGIWIKTKINRWQCIACQKRLNKSIYASTATLKKWEEERQANIQGARHGS